MARDLTGWLLDLYAHPQDGLVLWLLDESGARRRLCQRFPLTFYVAGPAAQLRAAWRWLKRQPQMPDLARDERRDLFSPQPLTVLAVTVEQPAAQPGLFRRLVRAFPDLTYYDADLHPALHHAARFGSFPLARCRVLAEEDGQVLDLTVLDSPWELEPTPPPLRILSLEPDIDPAHAEPSHLLVRDRRSSYCLSLEPARPLLVNLRAILNRHDPDILLTIWGDTWLLPHLLTRCQEHGIVLPLNREPDSEVILRPERTYFAYGGVIYRGQQVHLRGRLHVDGHNAMLYHDYGLEGVLEMARVSGLPLQTAGRVSPGTGISAMQITTALREGILVPWRKQQAERPKTALELLRADQGGLVYQPLTGLHRDVAEIDFISMYPSIMAHFNISPETVGSKRPTAELVPELGVMVSKGEPGLVPQTLRPLLDKRIAIKLRLAELPAWDPRRKALKARASAHKWLLVTCFGYLGYKNARFGRIEAHEAVTAYGREALLQAKEAAEDMGCTVLHLYVDGLWVQRSGSRTPSDFQAVLEEIASRTGLPVALEGVYRWVAFLPSRVNARVPVANRYFGVFQDGSKKVRGIELRRQDTPLWIAGLQGALLDCLAQARTADELPAYLPQAVRLVRRAWQRLRLGRVPLRELVVSQKLSQELPAYTNPSPAARAAAQLEQVGKHLRPGQRVRFLHTLGKPGVYAWDLPGSPDPAALDLSHYRTLLLRAVSSVLAPVGLDEATLDLLLAEGAVRLPLTVPLTQALTRNSQGQPGLDSIQVALLAASSVKLA